MTVGEKIKNLRKEQKLSQQDIADAIGVERANVSNWETGKANPQLANLSALSKRLGVSIGYFLEDSGKLGKNDAEKLNPERSLLVALLVEVAMMKSVNEDISYEEAKDQIKKKANLISEGLDSWLPG